MDPPQSSTLPCHSASSAVAASYDITLLGASAKGRLLQKAWSEEEVQIMTEAIEAIGEKWAGIAKLLPGRTDKNILVQCQWNTLRRQRRARDRGVGQ